MPEPQPNSGSLAPSNTSGVFVSFLIPVYNAEQLLPDTLESILQQDDGHIEIVCVNDGSTDGSGAVLSDYASRHRCITVAAQPNQGITAARDTALAKACGDWICFVDDDDIVARDAVQVFHRTASSEADIVYYNYDKFTGDAPNQGAGQDRAAMKSDAITWYEGAALKKLQSDCINRFASNTPLVAHKVLPTPWAKLYRREFLARHGLQFRPEVRHEEDVVFNFEALGCCTKAERVDYTSYYYRWSIASESHRFRPHLADDARVTLAAYRDIIAKHYSNRQDISVLYRYRVLWELLYCVILGPMHPKNAAPYRQRRQQFAQLTNDPLFASVLNDSSVKTTRFELKQSVLATLIRWRWFWLLNAMRGIVGRAR
jgi:glycosyltransferase involved in cell wall biosynthesis